MAETVFSCACGMILKVYGDDQAGSRIECPSCKASVVVPGGRPKSAPPPEAGGDLPDEDAPESGFSMAFVALYVAIIAGVTLGLVKYLLFPALAEPGKGAGVHVAAREDADDTEVKSKKKKAPKAASSESSKRPRKPVAPVESEPEAPLPVYPADAGTADPAPDKPPVAPVAPPGPSRDDPPAMPDPPAKVDPPAMPDPPAKVDPPAKPEPPDPPKPTIPKEEAKPKAIVRTPPKPEPEEPFANITNARAKKALNFALQNLQDVEATKKAEMYLKRAEETANGDPDVLAAIKKLRAKITEVRKRAR